MKYRTFLIQKLIHINESIFFYPRLKRFYKKNLTNNPIRIIDVGANKGQSIDFFLRLNPNAIIYTFEPNKKLFDLLKNKYKLNKNMLPHHYGLSNVKGELLFHENIMDETSTFEELNLESKYLEKKAKILGVDKENIIVNTYKVPVIRLIDFLEENKEIKFDVLKIDVEGHELPCLEGLFVKNNPLSIRFIQLERHHDDMYLNNNQYHKIEALLSHNGFEKITEIKHGFGDFSEIIYKNKFK